MYKEQTQRKRRRMMLRKINCFHFFVLHHVGHYHGCFAAMVCLFRWLYFYKLIILITKFNFHLPVNIIYLMFKKLWCNVKNKYLKLNITKVSWSCNKFRFHIHKKFFYNKRRKTPTRMTRNAIC